MRDMVLIWITMALIGQCSIQSKINDSLKEINSTLQKGLGKG
jgi:hypothetical protein